MNEYWDEKLAELGFNITAALAGFFGGLLAVLYDPRGRKGWHCVANVIAGGIAAGYSTDLIGTLLGLSAKYAGGIGFTVGLFGMAIVDKTIDYIAEHELEDLLELINPLKRFFKNKDK
jgi:hypothetical protein